MSPIDYTLNEAIKEAQRCLHCKVPGCKKGCPINNDIPEWIAQLAKGNFGNAMTIINARSNLPAVCGRVCGHERQCEGNCVLGKKGEAIHIGKLERFLADFDSEAGWSHEYIPEKSRGRVAVIGSGPAGLTIAWRSVAQRVCRRDIRNGGRARRHAEIRHTGVPSAQRGGQPRDQQDRKNSA